MTAGKMSADAAGSTGDTAAVVPAPDGNRGSSSRLYLLRLSSVVSPVLPDDLFKPFLFVLFCQNVEPLGEDAHHDRGHYEE